VDVVQTFANLSDNRTDFRVLHPVVFTKQTQQLAICAVLYQQIDILLIGKITVERGEVAMGKIKVNAQLSSYLILILLLSNLFLGHHFETH
jgi:hypothetical protein